MKDKFTPGPWEVVGYTAIFPECNSKGRPTPMIASVADDVIGYEKARANARLIAAAPDLLAAAVRILDILTHEMKLDKNPDPTSPHGQLKAAIAKAEGKS